MKKFLSILLTFMLVSLFTIQAFASESNQGLSQEEIDAINEVNIAKYAQDFINTIQGDLLLEAGDVTVFYSENDRVSGYCVDILSGAAQYGYIIVKFVDNNPVVSEFVIASGVENPYDTILKQNNISDNDVVFYSIGSNEYQVLDQQNSLLFVNDSQPVLATEFETLKEEIKMEKQTMVAQNIDDNVINYSDLDGWSVVSDSYEGTVNSSKTITGAGSITYYCSSDVTNSSKTYACSIVALSNLMKYYSSRGYDKIDTTFSSLYDTLWNLAGTSSSGSTSNGNEPGAAKKYLTNLGYTCTYSSFKAYSSFTSALDGNKPCIFTYGAQFGASKGGHAVLAVGYVDTSSYEYLKIADGWNSYLRYINFNGYDYTRTNGWSFSLSK